MDLIIRQAEEKDIKPMAEIDKICFSVPWSEKSFSEEIKNNRLAFYVVAEIEWQYNSEKHSHYCFSWYSQEKRCYDKIP